MPSGVDAWGRECVVGLTEGNGKRVWSGIAASGGAQWLAGKEGGCMWMIDQQREGWTVWG